MIDEKFVLVGIFLTSIGTLSYLINTIKGKVKPNKVSWFLWALAPMIAFAAQFKQNVGWSSLLTFSVGFSPLLVFLASFINKKSEWKITKLDIVCGSISLVGIVLWYLTQIGNVAIFFSILADGTAALPTIVKSLKAPETEDWKVFFFAMLNGAITLLTLKQWTFAYWGFPLYIFLICLVLFVLIKYRLGKKLKIFAD